jgi:hypothetical protein
MDGAFFLKLEEILNSERLDVYRQDGADEVTTLSRYLLNMAICESLYSPLQFAEIALRNAIHAQLTARYNGESWYDIMPSGDLLRWQSQQILNARDKLESARRPITPGGMVAELHFGFWTGFFNHRHGRTGLGHFLSSNVFVHAPCSERSFQNLDTRWQKIRKLRNRVFHHERLIHWRDLDQQHAALLTSIKWISPELEELARALDRFTEIRNDGLTPWRNKIKEHWPNNIDQN